jgi:hypothetical protein
MISNNYHMDFSDMKSKVHHHHGEFARQFDIQWVHSRPSSFTPISILDVLETTADESDYSSEHRGSRSTETLFSSNCTSPVGSSNMSHSLKSCDFLKIKKNSRSTCASKLSFSNNSNDNVIKLEESNKILFNVHNNNIRNSCLDNLDMLNKVPYKKLDWNRSFSTKTTECSSSNDSKDYINEQEEVTTLMLRNFPHPCSSYEPLLEHLKIHGVDIEKDVNFIYIPFAHRKYQSLGFAFVNFVNSKKAEAFLQSSQGTKLFSFENQNRSLHIAPAQKQGMHANLIHLVETSVHVDNLLEVRHQPLFSNATDDESSSLQKNVPTCNLFAERIAQLAQIYQSRPKIRYLLHKLQSFNEI